MAKMVVSLGSSRRRKRGEVLFRFESFCQAGYPAQLAGAFRDNVRTLLGFSHLEAGLQGETKCWLFQLELHRHPPTVVRLFVVEEEVAASAHRQCHLYRLIGWGRHLICSKRFHFVLPKRESSVETDGLCYGINHGGSEKASKGTATSRGHLLHGIVHLNGYGHLVGLHGFEGGSDFVSGPQIMDLWDRICSALHVRKVSLVDTARKGHMVLRLLHGVAYGEAWFGRWGYKYGRPSYVVALQSYQKSVHALQSIPLCVLVPHLACFSQELAVVVTKYQAISGHKLLSLGDLLRFMLELRTRLPATSVTVMNYRGIMSDASCRWSAKRVDMAARAVVDALRRSEQAARWVTRQEVRDAARAYIGDTGLLDFVLKSLGNHIVGNYVVRRAMNPVTKVLEYCLKDVSSVLPAVGGVPSRQDEGAVPPHEGAAHERPGVPVQARAQGAEPGARHRRVRRDPCGSKNGLGRQVLRQGLPQRDGRSQQWRSWTCLRQPVLHLDCEEREPGASSTVRDGDRASARNGGRAQVGGAEAVQGHVPLPEDLHDRVRRGDQRRPGGQPGARADRRRKHRRGRRGGQRAAAAGRGGRPEEGSGGRVCARGAATGRRSSTARVGRTTTTASAWRAATSARRGSTRGAPGSRTPRTCRTSSSATGATTMWCRSRP